jgi:RHS repeat-associated protein
MISRRLETEGTTYSQGWDAENRLISVTAGGTTTQFAYDGDGNLVKKTVGSTTTVYIGAYFERTGDVTTSYYYAGGTRLAKRSGGVVTYLHGDHLGSASLATSSSGVVVANSSTRYYPYGTTRSGGTGLPTDYRFTGQLLDGSSGLYHMGARWYDGALGRWLSADTIIPNPADPQSLNRYSWVLGNPLGFVDPSGHLQVCNGRGTVCADAEESPLYRSPRFLQWPYNGRLASGIYHTVPGQGDMSNAFGDTLKRDSPHEGVDIHTRPQVKVPTSAGITGRAKYDRTQPVNEKDDRPPGGHVTIDRIPGRPNVTVSYFHLEFAQQEGDTFAVGPASVVGTATKFVGNTDSNHIHLELRVDGKPVDPLPHMVFPPGTRFNYTPPNEPGFVYYVYVPARNSEHAPGFGGDWAR